MAGPSSVMSATAGTSDFAADKFSKHGKDHFSHSVKDFPYLKEMEGKTGSHVGRIHQDSHQVFDKLSNDVKRAAYHFSST